MSLRLSGLLTTQSNGDQEDVDMLRWWANYQYWKQDTLRLEYRMLLIIILVLAGACLIVGWFFVAPGPRGKWVNSPD